MYFSLTNDFDVTGMKSVSHKGIEVCYFGFPIKLGCNLGDESITSIIEEYMAGGVDFSSIYGHFYLSIYDQHKDERLFFTDNSGICKLYFTNCCLSSSFLQILENNKLSTLNPEGVIEFLRFGSVFFNQTVVDGVQTLSRNKVLKIKSSRFTFEDKNLPLKSSVPDFTFQSFFTKIFPSLKEKKISLDITGGSDSRLLVALFMNSGVDFELAITGKNENQDVIIAKKIASALNKDFHLTQHNGHAISDVCLLDLFHRSDGVLDLTVFHRLQQYYQERTERGVELQITGAGGELYKDFWWLQDFPFYCRKKSNLTRLYDTRISPIILSNRVLTNEYNEYSSALKRRTISEFKKKYLSDINTQTYDQIYYDYKMVSSAGTMLHVANNILMTYSPLLEYDLFRIGYNMSRPTRFYNWFQRKIISDNAPSIAKIQTTDGHGLSTGLLLIIQDVILYAIDKAKRTLKLLARKIFNKTFFQESPTDIDVYEKIKESNMFLKAVTALKAQGVLRADLEMNEIPQSLVGKICSLGFLIHKHIR